MRDYSQLKTLLLTIFGQLVPGQSLTVEDGLQSKGFGSLQRVAGAMLLREHGIKIKPQELAQRDTVRDLAEYLCDKRTGDTEEVAKNGRSKQTHHMTPTQRDWQQAGFNEHYNIYGGWAYDEGQIDRERLGQAVKRLVDDEEELRLRIARKDGTLEFSSVRPDLGPYLESLDFSALPLDQAHQKAIDLCRGLQRAFRFDGVSPLCRFIDFRLDTRGGGWIFIIVHHFTVDGFGWGNLLRKLSHLYTNLDSGGSNDPYGGSGMGRIWSEAIADYGAKSAKEELKYWQALPWEDLNLDLDGSQFSSSLTPPQLLFNDEDAERLHQYELGTPVDENALVAIFDSQATILRYLEPEASRMLLKQVWRHDPSCDFDDFDVFAAAAAKALGPYCRGDHLWLDMLAATRSGIFPDLDASGSVGYISELTPFVAPNAPEMGLLETTRAIATFRRAQPRSGIGLRALKAHMKEPEAAAVVDAMKCPNAGINYHASLLYSFSGTMLDLKDVPDWLGPTLDERGIRYRFWYRVSFADGQLQMVLRYDPTRYTVQDGLAVADATLDNLRAFVSPG